MFINENKRWIALVTIITFFWVFQLSAYPHAPVKKAVPAPDSYSVENTAPEDAPSAVEKASPTSTKAKKRRFPWLLVVAGVVLAGAAAYYFLVYQKQEFTLTVVRSDGVSGTPDAGETKHKRGSNVNYNFTLASGYRNLKVTLDGTEVAASGSVSMKKNHRLEAIATKECILTVTTDAGVDGTPVTGSYTYASGETVNYSYSLKPGFSNLEVNLDGSAVSPGGTIIMNADHTLTATTTGQRKLTVTRATGVSGTPATGTYSYTNGAVVNYSYKANLGYYYFVVFLDGTPVIPVGSVTMNTDHTLEAKAENGLQLEWLLNNNAQDTSTRGRHGTQYNTVATTDHKGVSSRAYYFNGTSAKIEGPAFDAHDGNKFTISFWVKIPTSISDTKYFMLTSEAYIAQVGSKIHFGPRPNLAPVQPNCTIPINTWTHIGCTFDGVTAKIYRNGALMDSKNLSFTYLTSIIKLGHSSYGYWRGYLDDLRIYSYVMSDTEIQTLAGL